MKGIHQICMPVRVLIKLHTIEKLNEFVDELYFANSLLNNYVVMLTSCSIDYHMLNNLCKYDGLELQ